MKCDYDENELNSNYLEAIRDKEFIKLINTLKVDKEIAKKYTTSLQTTVSELKNCRNCKSLLDCQNRMEGYVFFPCVKNKQIIFSYASCKYMKEEKKKSMLNNRDALIENAKMSDIYIEKERKDIIKWMKNFYDNYNKNTNMKGLYLNGSFGSGKTYLISALFNELKKKKVESEIIYYPEMLRNLKADFDTFNDTISYYENVDLLLIDDIGAEKVTEWSRDEILGTILQKRMNNYKTTFFTSNLTMNDLEQHLKISNSTADDIKAKRIIERIKQLSTEMELIGENKRK